MKEKVKQCPTLVTNFDGISFGLFSDEEILKMSVVEIKIKDLYDAENNIPAKSGPLDGKLGASLISNECEECKKSVSECNGHFGHIKLELPVFHVGFIKQIYNIMQMVCKSCGEMLLSEDRKFYYKKKIREVNDLEIVKKIILESKTCNICYSCNSYNGTVRKTGLKINYEKKIDVDGEEVNVKENLNPMTVYNIFKLIKEEDFELLAVKDPKNLIIKNIIVPPSVIRPSVSMEAENGSNEDDLTVKLSKIVHCNELLKNSISKGNGFSIIQDDWDFLQIQCGMLINSDVGKDKPIRGLIQRLKGKHGRFRGNLSGKRVDFSGRTVISPDPNISIEEVGIPQHMAKILTIEEKVTDFNKKKMQELIENGPNKYPGANYITSKQTKVKRFLMFGDRKTEAKNIKIGDKVERHLIDGDVVLFNRQPSLHRQSIMAHKTKIFNQRTLKLNICVCAPYNADFDGDEMNVHVPQRVEARAEALTLMGVKENLTTAKNGEILITPSQDFITALYLISSKDVFFDKVKVGNVLSWFLDGKVDIKPTITHPVELYTGKQILEALIKNSVSDFKTINLETKNKNLKKIEDGILAEEDGFVVIREGKYLFGRLDKSIVGGGYNSSLLYRIFKSSPKNCVNFMDNASKLCSRIMAELGFSIGLDDVIPTPSLVHGKSKIIDKGRSECKAEIKKYFDGNLEHIPGLTLEKTLEKILSHNLSQIRDDCGTLCINELSHKNSPLIMHRCGSKGSKINISQMVMCVGQQVISGGRIPNGFETRTLPHFSDSFAPEAKGFVGSSFFNGLTATEFLFHAVSGREGLVDTAVKTAETGYMQRRLMKALEDVVVTYDGKVRNLFNEIIQYKYGDDDFDPNKVEDGSINKERIFLDLISSVYTNNLKTTNISKKIPDFNEIEEAEIKKFLENKQPKIQKYELDDFENIFKARYQEEKNKILINFGTPVGVLAGQSIGEPGTQMTLKTFHFAGVSSMNITLGVPRLKEIINSTKNISTPILTIYSEQENVESARAIVENVKNYKTKDLIKSMKEVINKYELILELEVIDIKNVEIIKRQLKKEFKLENILVNNCKVIINSTDSKKKKEPYFQFKDLKRSILECDIKGIKEICRSVINKYQGSNYNILMEGSGLLKIFKINHIDQRKCVTNNIIEIYEVLGIEAARNSIINEIEYTMSNHGMKIDRKHIMLLADSMCARGEVLGITRFGINKMKISTLMMASFEQTADHLFDAAVYNRKDGIKGVSENIIVGSNIPIGTGMVELIYKE
ncbi:DNA-directed RNA polymerase III subunit RPC1 [Spraguea lophii 42_110]|uniref:DNA-directed RNA polymerase subunit n=1 Tax=Spraguea lophii (strain 42_110) TaxID=1358809 RepID=S7WA53_SPRLO|nr:DNA-directed RNA polymerase III subunit RPC1 [Spraguea lophii 42_110]